MSDCAEKIRNKRSGSAISNTSLRYASRTRRRRRNRRHPMASPVSNGFVVVAPRAGARRARPAANRDILDTIERSCQSSA
jgi:hypothetical protein